MTTLRLTLIKRVNKTLDKLMNTLIDKCTDKEGTYYRTRQTNFLGGKMTISIYSWVK